MSTSASANQDGFRFQAVYPATPGWSDTRSVGAPPNQREQTKRLRTFEDARAFAANVDAKRFTGIEVDLRGGRRLFAEYAESWLTRRTLAVRTSELYRQLLHTHLLPTFGSSPLQRISAEQVERWVVESRPKAPVATANAYRLLRSILATAVDDTLLGRNPCRIKGAGKEDTPERPYVEPTLVLALAEAAHPRLRTMILLTAFGAGYRISELPALRQRDFDPLHGTISVTRTIDKLGRVKGPKSAAGHRTDHLPRFLLDALDDHLTRFVGPHPDPDAPLFPGEQRGHMSPVWHQKHWSRTRDTVGVPQVHFHDLRHTAGTLAAQHGATLAELKRLLGHSSVRAALRYQHAAEGRLKAIAERVGAEVEAELSRGSRGVQPPPPPGFLKPHPPPDQDLCRSG